MSVLCLLAAAYHERPARAGDSYEPDNTIATAQAIEFGVTQVHSLHAGGSAVSVPPADVDFVTFRLTAASDVIVQTDADGGAADTLVRLYDGASVQVAWDDDGNPAGNRTSRLEAANLPAGTYSVSVESYSLQYGAAKRIKSYRLTVAAAAPGARLPPLFTGKLTANGAVGAAFNYAVSALGSLAVVYTAGGLPPGLSLAGASIAGVPTLAGTYDVTLTAANGAAPDASATVVITVAEGGVISTAAGDGKFSFTGDGGPASAAALNIPVGVAVDGGGAMYIADAKNHRVRRMDGATGLLSTVAGTGAALWSGDGGPATAATLNNPTSVAVDAAGNLYVADAGNHCVRRVAAGSGVITTVAGKGLPGFSGDGGPAAGAELNGPLSVALDSAGNLYIADTSNNCVRRVAADGGVITTVAGVGTPGFSGDGGPAATAELNWPVGVAVDAARNVFIADTRNNRVRLVDAAGTISTLAGTGVADYSGDGGPASAAALNGPRGLALDAAGLVIADTGNDRVRRIEAATGLIATVAGDGDAGFSGDGGLALLASLWEPAGVAADAAGYLFIADAMNSRVRKVGVATPPALTSPATASGTRGALFTPCRVTATGHPPPGITAANLPPGLSLSGGLITGVPAVSGAVDVTLSAQNSVGSAQSVLRLLLAAPPGSPNNAPAFASPPVFITATPNPGVAGMTVSFVAPTVSDPDGDLVAYTWDFGDAVAPVTAIGAIATHVFSTASVYMVTLTATDGVNSVSAVTPLGVNDPSVTQDVIVSRAQLKLNFAKANSDTLAVSGLIPLRDKFTPAGKIARFYFGNLARTFVLNEKGTVTSKTDVFKLSYKQKAGAFIDQEMRFYSGKFSVSLKKQTLAADVAPLGFVQNVTNAVPITVPVLISIENDSYLQNVMFVYKSTDKSGSGVKLKEGASLPSRTGQ